MEIPGWAGDIPSWLSVIGAAFVIGIGYFRRTRIADWFKRATNAPPSFESQPSFISIQKGATLEITNHGPGTAFDVRCEITGVVYIRGLDFIGQYNFDSIDVDETFELHFGATSFVEARGEATVVVSWILRHDPGMTPERDFKTFTLKAGPLMRDDGAADDFNGF